ncbi:MAG: hypothetical protein AB1512_10275 [Thermodesulfobacteriota bacterium]
MNAVVNAGPLIALGKLGLIDLLGRLYDPAVVPKDVHDEVVTRGIELGQPDAYAVKMALARGDLLVVEVDIQVPGSEALVSSLHRGERAAICLALQRGADWVLLDDELARKHARQAGLRTKGTLGVIIEANRRKLLDPKEVEIAFQSILPISPAGV